MKKDDLTESQTKAYNNFCSDAIQVQNACNVVAVLNSFANHVTKCYREGIYTDNGRSIATDPPFLAFMDKLMDMSERPDIMKIMKAFDECEQ